MQFEAYKNEVAAKAIARAHSNHVQIIMDLLAHARSLSIEEGEVEAGRAISQAMNAIAERYVEQARHDLESRIVGSSALSEHNQE